MPDNVFHCQECDVPIKLDDSLLKPNMAQLKQLISKKQQRNGQKDAIQNLNPEEFIPSDRLSLYNAVNTPNTRPIHIRNMIESEDEDEDDEEEDEDDQNNDNNDDNNDNNTSDDTNDSMPNSLNANSYLNRTFSARLKTLTEIFEILSTNQQINHPLSDDCAVLLIENYKAKFDLTQKEKDSYLTFLKKLRDKDNHKRHISNDSQNTDGFDESDISQVFPSQELDHKLVESMSEHSRLSELEKKNLKELKELELRKAELEDQLKTVKSELQDLQENKLAEMIKMKNKLQSDLNMKHNKLEQSNAAYRMQLKRLDDLREMNIYTTIFNISFDSEDKYGSINGFRLGYRVVWPEVNAALGQIVLLLVFLTTRLKVKLRSYRLVPMGSQSKIIKLSTANRELNSGANNGESNDNSQNLDSSTTGESNRTQTELNLYSSDEFSLGKLFNFNKLDVAMIALLDIVSLLETRLRQIDPEIRLPYRISPQKGTIGTDNDPKSIRVTSNKEWTQSCKYLLTDLNWILTFTSVHTAPSTI
ncbi:autophagy protein Apg6-domain-containing protein [Scheffersomyces xylosifermentans]|uniref:autophagy protein Apg6-domain-containing protein n=1 Tax=Scheffersomyces xylosifermentans TaxID=1304137 RepID=UPI00315CB73D